jgi:hypothetical protein
VPRILDERLTVKIAIWNTLNLTAISCLMSAIFTSNEAQPNFACTYCNQPHRNQNSLRAHIARHHRIERGLNDSESELKCRCCGKTFSRKDNLNRHLRNCSQDNQSLHSAPTVGDKRTYNEGKD